MNISSEIEKIAIIQFIALLAIILFLCVAFVFFLLFYIKSRERNRELERQNEIERIMTQTISEIQESERNRISRDLHDTITQDIRTSLIYLHKLNRAESQENFSNKEKEILQKIQKIEEQNLKNIRTIIQNLTPPEIESASFIQLLSDFCADSSEKVLCKFYAEKSELYKNLTTEQKLHIFRIVQESVNNAIKHSGAQEINVIVRKGSEFESEDAENKKRLVFMISDDGHGFFLDKLNESSTSGGTHLGLRGIKSRASILGAKLEVKSNEETGTQVKLTVEINS